jgi:hypothetical protein
MQKLVKRMTRFIVCKTPEEALTNLSQYLDDLGYTWKLNSSSVVKLYTFIFIRIEIINITLSHRLQ